MDEVVEINDWETLALHRTVWDALLAETPNANFFQTFDWFEVYWRWYGAAQRLRTLVISRDGQPVGILPLVVRREPRKVGVVSILTYPLDDWGSFYGPIGANAAEILAAGLRYLARAPRDWDVLELRGVGDLDELRQPALDAFAAARLSVRSAVRATTALIDLPKTWDEYWGQKASKFRNNYRRWERRLAERGEIELIRHRPRGTSARDEDPRWDLYDTCEELASRSWQAASSDGTTLSSESIRGYLRETHAAAARAGGVDVNVLTVGGEPLAYAYNYFHHGAVYGLRIGYDANASKEGAGNILYAMAIADSIARGDRVYDLGPGSLEYKRHWASRFVSLLQLTHCNRRSIKGRLLGAGHSARHWLQQQAWFAASETPA